MVVFGDGKQTRDFTYVSDSARGIMLAGTVDAAVGRTVNVGSGTEVTIDDLAAAVAGVAGCSHAHVNHGEPRPGDVRRLCADISHARALLGYEPRVSLADGLNCLLTWYRAQGVSAEELLRDEVVHNWSASG
jgi:UDP-glucose 4-epimerase